MFQNGTYHFSWCYCRENSVYAKFAYTATDGKTYLIDYYNLDVIISVGYRIKSQRGTQFRIWATKTLKEYLLKGYAVNQRFERLEYRIKEKANIHDRFLIIDNDLYHIGASLKDLGKKLFAFSKMEMNADELLRNIR